MAFYVNEKRVDTFSVVTGKNCQEQTAKKYLIEYAKKVGIEEKENASFNVRILINESSSDDEYNICLNKLKLNISGGKRGVIYGTFAFLEKIGFRFFTPELETVPKNDIWLNDFSITECSPFLFRDVLSAGAIDKNWSLKQKLNSDLWNTRKFTEEDGGGYNFAGIPAHSLTGEFLLKPYVDSNPEYFALKNGVRLTDRMGQICMTNVAAIDAVVREIYSLIENNPNRNIISVSQGDNHNFCECERCKEAVEKQGLVYTYFQMLNKIAHKVKEKYPNVLLHTLAYNETCDKLDFPLADNIMIQYCHGECNSHAITDQTCNRNRESNLQIRKLASKCSNLFIWHYTNCFKYELFEYPFIHNFLPNIRFFADIGVKGVFNEGMHKNADEAEFATAYELRSYLLAKIMWNPYMSEVELKKHTQEFCEAFYGKGYEWILKYLQLYEEYESACADYNSWALGSMEIEGKDRVKPLISLSKMEEFINKANTFLNCALRLADEVQILRIEKLKTCVLYYELFWTMRDVLENGTIQEKQQIVEKNKELIQRIIHQKLLLTFYGQPREEQNKKLKNMGEIPPSEWNYKW